MRLQKFAFSSNAFVGNVFKNYVISHRFYSLKSLVEVDPVKRVPIIGLVHHKHPHNHEKINCLTLEKARQIREKVNHLNEFKSKSYEYIHNNEGIYWSSSSSGLKVKEKERLKQIKAKIETSGSNDSPSDPSDRPSVDVLHKVFLNLQDNLTKIFIKPMDYSVYKPDLEFIDNIRNKVFKGLPHYITQVSMLRFVGHLKFAYVKLEILSMSQSVPEGRITVRWRIAGVSGLRIFLKIWEFRLSKWREMFSTSSAAKWHDGISYFDVDANGKIFRHIVDKLEVDKELEKEKIVAKNPLGAKLALILGLLFPQNLEEALEAFKTLL